MLFTVILRIYTLIMKTLKRLGGVNNKCYNKNNITNVKEVISLKEKFIKISTHISSEFKETEIIINAAELTEEIQELITYISNINSIPSQIIGDKNNKMYFINIEHIVCIFSKEKYNYVRTKEGIYRIKYKLYELEEILNKKDFIRISNSCIININQVENFDISILGTILVNLKDKSQETVSKRNIVQIRKLLKERGNL